MSFVKSVNRRVSSMVKFADHGLAKLGSNINSGVKFMSEGHNMYRAAKHQLLHQVPELEPVVRVIEHSPIGLTINGAREEIGNVLSDAKYTVQTAQARADSAKQRARTHSQIADGAFNQPRGASSSSNDNSVEDFVYGRNQGYVDSDAPKVGRWV